MLTLKQISIDNCDFQLDITSSYNGYGIGANSNRKMDDSIEESSDTISSEYGLYISEQPRCLKKYSNIPTDMHANCICTDYDEISLMYDLMDAE